MKIDEKYKQEEKKETIFRTIISSILLLVF
jgi:hypothetical protein